MSIIGKKISETRKSKGLTQEELAELSKVNLRTIQRIENNESEPRGKTLFLSVQHPGEQTKDLKNPTSTWPFDEDNIPKSAVVAIKGDLIEKMNRLHLLV